MTTELRPSGSSGFLIGACIPTEAVDGESVRRCIRQVEESGLDHMAVGEHVVSGNPTPAVFTSLAFAAAITHRVRLVSAIALAPLYPAALLAKLAVTLDALSGQRLILGVGAGGEHPEEFSACGVPLRERGVRTDDALRVVSALTTTSDPVRMETERFVLDGIALDPPATRRIPQWIGGRGDVAIERATRYGDAWYPYLVTPDQVADGRARLTAAARSRSVPIPDVVAYCFLNVGSSAVAARRQGVSFVARRYRLDAGRVARYVVAGDPAQCASQLLAFRDAGATGVTVRLACELTEFEPMLETIATEIIPRLS